MMFRSPMLRRRSRRTFWPFLSRFFYINPEKQYMIIVISAIAMATFVFSGILLFRQSDQGDLMTRGRWLMKQGKAALAVKEFEALVHQYANSYDGHLELGKAYMQINEPDKAAREFRVASRLKSGNLKDSGAHVAISRMMIAQGKYEDAERQLFQAYNAKQQNRRDPELLSAMADLYEAWGDSYAEGSRPDYEQAFIKYSAGLRYVNNYAQQTPLQDKLLSVGDRLANALTNNKEYDKAIAVLKRTLHYKPTADTLIEIASLYEQKGDLDRAIYWDRKAYEMDPRIISLELSNLLLRKGKELNEAHQPDTAEKFFVEAQKINETIKLPLETLYPVTATDIDLVYKVNPTSFDLSPTIKFNIRNAGNYPVNYLVVKAFFLTGDEKLGEAQRVIATAQDPLAPQTDPRGVKSLELSPVGTIQLEDLEKGKLRVKLMVNYTDDPQGKWSDIKTVEMDIPEAQKIADVKK